MCISGPSPPATALLNGDQREKVGGEEEKKKKNHWPYTSPFLIRTTAAREQQAAVTSALRSCCSYPKESHRHGESNCKLFLFSDSVHPPRFLPLFSLSLSLCNQYIHSHSSGEKAYGREMAVSVLASIPHSFGASVRVRAHVAWTIKSIMLIEGGPANREETRGYHLPAEIERGVLESRREETERQM